MAGRRKAVSAKAALKDVRTITITIEASESNLQRLAAFLLFAELPMKLETYEDKPLPWEDPNDPRFQQSPPELEVDYDVVHRTIAKQLEQYLERHGTDATRKVLESFGAPRLSKVPQHQLLDLHRALEQALQAGPEPDA